jgi:hypothetical protein
MRGVVGLIRNDALLQALKDFGFLPESATNFSIRTTGSGDGYVRWACEYVDEEGEQITETSRVIDGHARAFNQIDWEALVGPDPPSPGM